jgi:hypothetical protein
MYRTVPGVRPGALAARRPVIVQSFSFGQESHGVPHAVAAGQAVTIVDLRKDLCGLCDNPAAGDGTGKDSEICARVLGHRGIVDYIADQAETIAAFASAQPAWCIVHAGIGDTDGRSLSVVVADEIGRLLLQRGICVEIEHLHIDLPAPALVGAYTRNGHPTSVGGSFALASA